MKNRILSAIASLLLMAFSSPGQVPALVNYQGRVAVGTTNFEGTGQFKFALVGPDLNLSQQATASAFVLNGGPNSGQVFFISLTLPGNGYVAAPAVTFTDATGTGATAVATVSFGAVTGIQLTNGGSGYSQNPTVTIAPPPPNIFTQRFWSNDGVGPQPLPGESIEPTTVVSLPVTKGLYSVLLGDSTISNMADIPTQIFSFAYNLRLRVWFNDGTHGFQVLSPDQRLAPAVYLADGAVTNPNIADGAIYGAKISPGSITGSQLANGTVTTAKIADGAISGAKIAGGAIGSSQMGSFLSLNSVSITSLTAPTLYGNVSVAGALTTGSNVSVGGTLTATGNISMPSANVSGAATMGSANISGSATMGSATVTGASSLAGNVTVGGTLTTAAISAQGHVYAAQQLSVADNTLDIGVPALTATGRLVNGTRFAGYFNGNVTISGNLSKSGGSFKIDHPLDPAGKYLSHSFVESPDMMNIYNGLVGLNDRGEATVQMPDWFSALNQEFRYQLTAMGAPGPNLYIANEISRNSFKIAGGQPGLKVSWQVTGIRHDAWANAHRIPIEENKNAEEHGAYLHPDLFGQPPEKEVGYARRKSVEQKPQPTKPSQPEK